MTPLTQKLGIEFPIIQAPMAGVSTPELAAAVSNAGGLGSLGLGAMPPEEARTAIRSTKALTNHPFNANLFCYTSAPSEAAVDMAWLQMLAPLFTAFGASAPARLNEPYISFNHDSAMLEVLLEERPAVVSFHFGLPPQPVIAALQKAGIILLASATSLEEARSIEAAGVDAIVAQGFEAGGHRGIFDPNGPDDALGTLALTRLLVKNTSLPVIAAGAIMDGAGIKAVIALGAQAAQLGTAFIRCPESAADAAFHAALSSHKAEHTVMTSAFSGRPARGIPNQLSQLAASPDAPPAPSYPYTYSATKALQAVAKAAGSADYSTQLAGQGAPLSRSLPAAELVRQLVVEMEAAV